MQRIGNDRTVGAVIFRCYEQHPVRRFDVGLQLRDRSRRIIPQFVIVKRQFPEIRIGEFKPVGGELFQCSGKLAIDRAASQRPDENENLVHCISFIETSISAKIVA